MYKIKDNETLDEFIYRIYNDKELKINTLTNAEIGEIINKEFDKQQDESSYRKKYQSFKSVLDAIGDKVFDNNGVLENYYEKEDELYKKSIEINRRINSHKRDLRSEIVIDDLKKEFGKMGTVYKVFESENGIPKIGKPDKEAVLLVGDWHVGSKFNNYINSYSREIFIERLNYLIENVKYNCQYNGIKKLKIINLGDMINGNIHLTNRIESDLNIVEQVQVVSQALCELLNEVSKITNVEYYSVLDNHSRITYNYKEHRESENLSILIDDWLEVKLENNPNVTIFSNAIDKNVGIVEIFNDYYLFAHGHKENPTTVLQNLILGLNLDNKYSNIKGMFLGHWHHDKVKNFLGRRVFFNGSLMGTDNYAYDKRLFSQPSQKLIIFEKIGDKQQIKDITIEF